MTTAKFKPSKFHIRTTVPIDKDKINLEPIEFHLTDWALFIPDVNMPLFDDVRLLQPNCSIFIKPEV